MESLVESQHRNGIWNKKSSNSKLETVSISLESLLICYKYKYTRVKAHDYGCSFK